MSHLNHLGQAPAVSHLQQETKCRLSCPSRPGGQPQITVAPPPTRAEGITLQFPPPHLYSQSKGKVPFMDLLLRKPCILEAMSPSDLRPHSRSPAPSQPPLPKPVCPNLSLCTSNSCCLSHCGATGEDGKDQYKARKKDVVAAESRVEAGHHY